MTDVQQVRVGVGVFLLNETNEVLLGQRKGSHGEGQWACPGGHQEFGESPTQAAYREVAEELGPGVRIGNLKPLALTNLTEYSPKHYIDIGIYALYLGGEIEVMEPDKVTSWKWFPLDALPDNLFGCFLTYMKAWQENNFICNI